MIVEGSRNNNSRPSAITPDGREFNRDSDSPHELKSGPFEGNPLRVVPIGLFAEPLFFRLPLCIFVGCIGAAILVSSQELMTSGLWWIVLITLMTVEPLGMHLILFGFALLFPHSIFIAWFYNSRKRVFRIFWAWLIFCAIGLIIYVIWVLPHIGLH